jgi:hypothetical protein
MKALRRLAALGLVAAVVAVVRQRKAQLPPQDGGWRELSGPDLR